MREDKQATNTMTRLFLVTTFDQLAAQSWTQRAIFAALHAIQSKAQAVNKLSYYVMAARLETWLENIENKPPFSLFAVGNAKLPFLNWSTLPGVNCPGAGDCWNIKKKAADKWGHCYSLRAYRSAHAVGSWLQNSILERGHFGRALIRQELARILDTPKFRDQKTVTLRLYVDGDFHSLEVLKFWLETARKFPRLRVYGYSKSLHFFADLVASGYDFPSNYALNGSGGGIYTDTGLHNSLKRQPWYRGEFISAPVSGNAKSHTRTKDERAQLRAQFPGEKIFVCPGPCGTCTSIKDTPHACGNLDEFKDVKIIIPIH